MKLLDLRQGTPYINRYMNLIFAAYNSVDCLSPFKGLYGRYIFPEHRLDVQDPSIPHVTPSMEISAHMHLT